MWNKLKNLLKQTFNSPSVEDQVSASATAPESQFTTFEPAVEIKEVSPKKKTTKKKTKTEYSSTPVVKKLKKKK
jgi:hypothetical protein